MVSSMKTVKPKADEPRGKPVLNLSWAPPLAWPFAKSPRRIECVSKAGQQVILQCSVYQVALRQPIYYNNYWETNVWLRLSAIGI